MCTVSMIGDQWRQAFPERHPDWNDYLKRQRAVEFPRPYPYAPNNPSVSKEEFDSLKKEMEELKKLLKAAKEFDEKTGQPDCEVDEKVELIRKIAKLVGVDFDSVFGKD